MENRKAKNTSSTSKTLERLFSNVSASRIWFFVLILIYLLVNYMVVTTSRSSEVVVIRGQAVALRSLTGAFSSLSNLCLILLVTFYKRPGFIVAIFFLICSFPSVLTGIFLGRNYSSIAGLFTNTLTVLTVVLLYRNSREIDAFQTKLRDQAATDMLTGLPNRFACSELLSALEKRGEKHAIAVINLNNFKRINNTMGLNTGNAVLHEIASRWRASADGGSTGTVDFVTCQGGDEFSIIIRGYHSAEELVNTIRFYKSQMEEKITVDDCDYYLNASIGYAMYPEDAKSADALLVCANAAMYAAKRGVGDTDHICHYSTSLVDAERALEMERKIRAALESNNLFFVLQPQFDISHHLSGFEALARMRDADGTVIPPNEFIPVAEKTGLIDQIDHAVFKQSAEYFGQLVQKTHTDSTLSVNVSVRHLMKNDFLDEVRDVLATSQIPPTQLEIEITESILIDSVDKALQCINELKKMGIKIAIDDFGTGYSSLSYLSTFPADMLKVDKAFIDQMNTNEASKQYVAAIISIGHVMNFAVICEGVEKTDQLDTLCSIGCDFIQGFIWGRPMSPDAATDLVMDSMKTA